MIEARSHRLTTTERNEIVDWATPRYVEPYWPFAPHQPQQIFLCLQGLEAFYGGAAGPGKSTALLMAALQYVDVPGYSALIVRRSFQDLSQPGAIMDKAWEFLGETPARPSKSGRVWTFPSGARLTFGYVQYHRDVQHYQSAEYQFIGMDELTYWEERTYTFLFSRMRRPAHKFHAGDHGFCDVRINFEKVKVDECLLPENASAHTDPRFYTPSLLDGHTTLAHVPLRMRTASNPGGNGHAWVKERFVDDETRLPGVIYVPAHLEDNPSVDRDSYIASMSHMSDPVERERMLAGDWDVLAAGGMFKRQWWRIITPDAIPKRGVRWIRYWDKAATKIKDDNARGSSDPDWTVGALVGLDSEGLFYIRDIVRIRDTPRGVELLIAQTAQYDGKGVEIWMEQEPGATGVESIDYYQRKVLVGYTVLPDRKSGVKDSKPKRAAPVSSAAEAGNVFVIQAGWNRPFFEESELFPQKGAHDDQVDAVSGAVHCLTERRMHLY